MSTGNIPIGDDGEPVPIADDGASVYDRIEAMNKAHELEMEELDEKIKQNKGNKKDKAKLKAIKKK